MNLVFKFLFKLLKENTFLISLVSVTLCSLAYLYQVLWLQKWKIPLGVADGIKVQYLFVIVLGLLYFFSAAYLQEYIRLRFYYYVPIRLANKTIERLMKKIKKLFPDKIDGDSKKRIERIEARCKRIRCGILSTIVVAILMGVLCFLPFFALFFILILDSNWLMVLILFCSVMFTTILAAYLIISKSTKKRIRLIEEKNVKSDGVFEDYLSACKEIVDYEEARFDEMESEKRSNSDNANYLVVFVTAIVMFAFGMFVKLSSTPPKEYWICAFENGNSYASVFETNDIFVLKRVIIEGDSIKLILNEQIIVNAGEKVFKHYTFEKVSVEK